MRRIKLTTSTHGWRLVETAVPILYLRGLSTGDFKPALSVLLGEEAIAGFSASTVTRLLTIWQEEYRGWRKRSLAGKQYIYIWADGLYFKVRLGDDERIACLVMVGVLPDGRKEVITIEDGYRESTEAWKTACATSPNNSARCRAAICAPVPPAEGYSASSSFASS